MKKLSFLSALIILSALSLPLSAQTYTHLYTAKQQKAAARWVSKGKWKNGFSKAVPAGEVNLVDFMNQYRANPEEWKAVMKWLQETDLQSIPNGSYPIPGTALEAKVQVDENRFSPSDLEAGKGSESHKKKIDLMYVVEGTEGFAALDHETSQARPYNEKKDRTEYIYRKDRLKLYNSIPGTFNVMFPDDWHIAKVQTDMPDQHIKVIVIKINYIPAADM